MNSKSITSRPSQSEAPGGMLPQSESTNNFAWIFFASIWTLLNVIKPFHIDDVFFLKYAQQIAQHPFDPYGFKIFWDEWPEHALAVICPPVLPYWLAPAVKLFGANTYLLKLWMAPFAFLFCFSLDALLRRFAPRVAPFALAATVLSPAFLPSLNLMLDVPALAISLFAVEMMLRAEAKSSSRLAMFGGLMAGIAMQAKYTVIATPIAMLFFGIIHRRLRFVFIPVVLAFLVFFTIELLIIQRYGESHFLLQSKIYGLRRDPVYLWMLMALPAYIGGTAPFLLAMSLALTRLPHRAKIIAMLVAGLAYVALAMAGRTYWTYSFAALGVGLVLLTYILVVERREADQSPRRIFLFLLAWLAIEVALSILISPFAATRRAMGIIVVATLLLARWLDQQPINSSSKLLRFSAAACALLGSLYYCIDLDDAAAQKQSVAVSNAAIHRVDPNPRIWFTGHWGYEFNAEQAGWMPLVPDNSQLHAGDWVVTTEDIQHQHILPLEESARHESDTRIKYRFLWMTTPTFYLGFTPMFLREKPTFDTQIMRVMHDVVPATSWTAVAATFFLERQEWVTDEAIRGIVQAIRQSDPKIATALKEGLKTFTPHALLPLLHDSDPELRAWAATSLGEVGDANAIEPLRGASNDPDETVRAAATEALAKLSSRVGS